MPDKSAEYSGSAALAISLLQGKWRIRILCVMRKGPVRLGQLGRLIPLASKKVLAENLRELHVAGLIVRNDLSSHILHVEYDLAEPLKAATYQLLDQLAKWGNTYEASGSIHLTSEKRSLNPGAKAEE
jgi:DNA-binding HxlR family transcriptional regulator